MVFFGGGVYNEASSSIIKITSSTIALNSAMSGGGLYSEADNSTIKITNSTIAQNSAYIDGASLYSSNFNSIIDVISSIIWTSKNINYKDNIEGGIVSLGYNIFSDTPIGTILTNDHTNASASVLNLLPLANNGGTTETMLPGLNSISIETGNPNDFTGAQNTSVIGVRDIGSAETGQTNVSVTKIYSSPIYLYPNPTSGNVTLELNEDYSTASLSITDITGKVVYSLEIKNQLKVNLDTEQLSKGIYIIRLQAENKLESIQLIKQ